MTRNSFYHKYLIRAHTILGLFVVFMFYLCTYFGSLTVFKPYINMWENTSRHFTVKKDTKFDLDVLVPKALEKLENPHSNITIDLPSVREKAIAIKYGFSEKIYFNPQTNEVLDISKESNVLTTFFNHMHIHLKLNKIGQLMMGLACVGVLFLTLSGVYLWLVKRKNRDKNSFNFSWHKYLSLFSMPYIIIFSLSGAVLGLMIASSSGFALSATDGKEVNMSKLVRPIVFHKECRVKASTQKAKMQSLNRLYDKAKAVYPSLAIEQILLNAWKDKNACVAFRGYLKNNRALSGRVNRISISYKGVDGSLLKKRELQDTHIMAQTLSSLYFLHFLYDEGVVVRSVVFIFGIIFAISLILGTFIWFEKRVVKSEKSDKNDFNILAKISLSIFFGILPASSFIVCLYWFLPNTFFQKETWLIGGFYSLWSFTLFFSFFTLKASDAIKLFFKLSALFLVLSVFMHGYRSGFYFWNSYRYGMLEIFWVDITLLFFAFLLIFASKKIDNILFFKRI